MTLVDADTPQNYDDLFPKHLGPPQVLNYTGAKICDKTKPTYTVELDAGAFRCLWELLEAEAKHRYPTHRAMSGARAMLRAVQSFRTAFWAQNEAPAAPETPRTRKRLTRTTKRS